MDHETASEIKKHGLDAITSLSRALIAAEEKCDKEEFQKIKKTIGLLIGEIDIDLLRSVYEKYPNLDDLDT